MTTQAGIQIIAIEEHYLDEDVDAKINKGASGLVKERLLDVGAGRIAEMDAAGIDVQILSHCPPGAQCFDESEIERALAVNDKLKNTIDNYPDRFMGFASMPTKVPGACADELQRCVEELGFKGALTHGLTDGVFIDDERYWPMFERAQKLDVPIYVHPGPPHPAVIEAYYKDYVERWPSILSAGWGFTVETATAGLRLMLSGVFDKFPDLKIILGHMGEGLPFLLWRVDFSFSKGFRPDAPNARIREIFTNNFWVTTSGNFSSPALLCTMMEMGIDRILFSVDWPYVENKPGPEWMEGAPLSQKDKIKVLNGNAKKLLRL